MLSMNRCSFDFAKQPKLCKLCQAVLIGYSMACYFHFPIPPILNMHHNFSILTFLQAGPAQTSQNSCTCCMTCQACSVTWISTPPPFPANTSLKLRVLNLQSKYFDTQQPSFEQLAMKSKNSSPAPHAKRKGFNPMICNHYHSLCSPFFLKLRLASWKCNNINDLKLGLPVLIISYLQSELQPFLLQYIRFSGFWSRRHYTAQARTNFQHFSE